MNVKYSEITKFISSISYMYNVGGKIAMLPTEKRT